MTGVLVGGGGPAGLAAAIALAERGVDAVVVDPAGGVSPARGELLAQGAAEIVARLGLAHVLTSAVQIEDVVSRWGAARAQSHGGLSGLGFHGWGIDRRLLSQAMLHRVRALGIPMVKARLIAHAYTEDGWQVQVSGTAGIETLCAHYLIDATGRPAVIARRHGATLWQDTDLVAVMWSGEQGRDLARMQAEATELGWWYAVPHAGGRSVGFVTSAVCAKSISRAPSVFLRDAMHDVSLISLGGLSQPVGLMDSRSALLDQMTGRGWLATGDAAAAFDPISSQGLFNALSGGFLAGQAAADVMSGDRDAALVYETLAARTANRTHGLTRLQYAAMPFDSNFWRFRAVSDTSQAKHSSLTTSVL